MDLNFGDSPFKYQPEVNIRSVNHALFIIYIECA